ncbi:hypothetical protein CBM2586_B20096 [Cupriavidus phytorum]|uniref:Uncharacterized protein n=1 Tax=Cupriavidus taiwanensis TaxID=164546 RepID=A0A375CKY6_9BURK|nr:hypothetical protein CBM2586_B20096 [Cupriavidus taiwanensis]
MNSLRHFAVPRVFSPLPQAGEGVHNRDLKSLRHFSVPRVCSPLPLAGEGRGRGPAHPRSQPHEHAHRFIPAIRR